MVPRFLRHFFCFFGRGLLLPPVDCFVDLAWPGSAGEVEDPVPAFLRFAMADVDWERSRGAGEGAGGSRIVRAEDEVSGVPKPMLDVDGAGREVVRTVIPGACRREEVSLVGL